jgi:hypothetical protein
MSAEVLIKFIKHAQGNEAITKRLDAIPEPMEGEADAAFEAVVAVGKEYGFHFTVENCQTAWQEKKDALAATSLSGDESDPALRFCVISSAECVAIAGWL